MNLRSVFVFVALTAAVSAEELPRKMKGLRESYPNVDVIYDSVTMADGKRLRSIITKPRDAKEKLPVIFLAGWLSCDSVEAPADTKDATGLILRGLAQTPGFCLFKIDKAGLRGQRRRLFADRFQHGACRVPRGVPRAKKSRLHRL
jgi:hypothetical protein